MNIARINNGLVGTPPNWMQRVTTGHRALGTQPEVRKLLGEPIPQLADLSRVPPHVAAMFGKAGVLERIRRKLAVISRKKGGAFAPAHGTIAAVDPDDTIYVGVEFLAACAGDEDTIAGILSHEWGHMVSDLPRDVDWSHLSYEELFELRRDEEAGADAYAGRALYQMQYKIEPVCNFLQQLDAQRIAKGKPASTKYFDVVTRGEILREGYRTEKRIADTARKLLDNPGYRHPSFSILLGVG